MADAKQEISLNLDGKLPLLALSAIGGVGAAFIVLLPLYIGVLVSILGLSEQSAGQVAAADMAGYTLATLSAAFWIGRVNIRASTLAFLAALIILNVICSFLSGYWALFGVRILTGFGAGGLTAVIVAAMSKTTKPDRTFGLWVVGQLGLASVGLYLLPSIIEAYSSLGAFMFLALLPLIVIPLAFFLPSQSIGASSDVVLVQGSTGHNYTLLIAAMGIVAVLVVYTGLASYWSFTERLASTSGLSPQTIGSSLSVASIAGLFGGIISIVIANKLGRVIPIALSILMIIGALVLVRIDVSTIIYMLSASAFLFGWNLILPFMLGAVATIDKDGRTISLANAAIGLGLVAGPLMGGWFLGTGSYSLLIDMTIICASVGGLLILPLARKPSQNNKVNGEHKPCHDN